MVSAYNQTRHSSTGFVLIKINKTNSEEVFFRLYERKGIRMELLCSAKEIMFGSPRQGKFLTGITLLTGLKRFLLLTGY